MRKLSRELNYEPIVPPKSNRKTPWDYDRQLYKERNKIERLFRRVKQFREIFTRYDKLDIIFISFVYFVFTVILLR
jgi:transposase